MAKAEYLQITVSESSLTYTLMALPKLGFEIINVSKAKKLGSVPPTVDPLDDETFGMLNFNTKSRRKMFAYESITLRRDLTMPSIDQIGPLGDSYLKSAQSFEKAKKERQDRKSHGLVFSSLSFAFSALGLIFLIGASVTDLVLSAMEGMDEMPFLIVPIILYSFTGLFVALGIAFLIVGVPRWIGRKRNEELDKEMALSKQEMSAALSKADSIKKEAVANNIAAEPK